MNERTFMLKLHVEQRTNRKVIKAVVGCDISPSKTFASFYEMPLTAIVSYDGNDELI